MVGAGMVRPSLVGDSAPETPALSGDEDCLESGFGFGNGRLRSLRVLPFRPMEAKKPPGFFPLSGPDEVDRDGVVLIVLTERVDP